jgi:hypothetical protein
MKMIIEVAAVRAGGRIPLGLLTIKQALNLPDIAEFRYRHITHKTHPQRLISRLELEKLAKQ